MDVGDDNDLGDTGNSEPVACDSAQSALPEVSFSMQTGRCLGEKHVGPSQPHLPKYPSTKAGKKRSFNQDWFQKFPWIEYSTPVFCFPYRHFQTSSAYADDLFTERGYKQWKSAMGKDGKITKHAVGESCRCNEAVGTIPHVTS